MRIRRREHGAMEGSDGLHPLVERVYAARGVRCLDDVSYSLSGLEPFATLKGIETAVTLLEEAVTQGRPILVVGDFDADGATSCAVARLGLERLGAPGVDCLVPNRFEYGYGLTPEIVEVASERTPELLITVDNGISSLAGVREAKRRGMRVLVTDHHLPGPELPEADAIVNPNQPGCGFPSKSIAGVGVMFYVLLALRARLRDRGWFDGGRRAEPNLAELLDLVALGTVADVVALDRNNRAMVAQGLARIRAGRCRPGIDALMRVAGRDRERTVASDLGFVIAPRLNAAGRLTDMSRGVACLLSDDPAEAGVIARELDELNRERREIEADMQAQALVHLAAVGDLEGVGFGLCLFDEGWHQGVIGILASRLKERLHRPVFVFAPESAHALKGSGRSVRGFHLRDALQALESAAPGLMTRYGGHAMAAGLTLPRAHLETFRRLFDDHARRHLDPAALDGVIVTDGALESSELNLHAAEALRSAGPWGQGFPEPLFDGEFEVVGSRALKGRHLKLGLRPAGSRRVLEGIQFDADLQQWREGTPAVRIVYRLDANQYRGSSQVSLIVEHLEPLEAGYSEAPGL